MLSNEDVYKMITSLSVIDRNVMLHNLLKRELITREQYTLLRNHRREFRDKVI